MKTRILPTTLTLFAPLAADDGNPKPCFAGTDVLNKEAE